MKIRYVSLKYDDIDGEGFIKFETGWKGENRTVQLDCLLDWMADLEAEYARIHAIEYGNKEQTEIVNTVGNTIDSNDANN